MVQFSAFAPEQKAFIAHLSQGLVLFIGTPPSIRRENFFIWDLSPFTGVVPNEDFIEGANCFIGDPPAFTPVA